MSKSTTFKHALSYLEFPHGLCRKAQWENNPWVADVAIHYH